MNLLSATANCLREHDILCLKSFVDLILAACITSSIAAVTVTMNLLSATAKCLRELSLWKLLRLHDTLFLKSLVDLILAACSWLPTRGQTAFNGQFGTPT